jgi:hypothetical protein
MTIGKIVDHVERQAIRTWANPTWWNLLVVLPWAIGTLLFIHEWRVDRDIATREQRTQGVITVHEPANHNRYGYVFSVGDKSFTGWESPGKDGLKIGKQVLVYYDPLNPNKNALTEFRALGINVLGPVPTMLFGIGAVAWYIGARGRKGQINSNQTAAPVPPSPS